MEQFFEGFFLQASLILALGAQNIFVLESGLQKRRHILVATLCSLCDILLISLGVLGAASLFVQYPWLKISFGVLGVGFLAYYGMLKLREKPEFQSPEKKENLLLVPIGVIVLQTMAFSLLNPHVYLDTVILIGGYSAKFSSLFERSLFGAGASLFSLIWFFGLSICAAALGRYLNNARVMRVISLLSGIILLALAGKLGMDVWHWI